MRDMDNAIFVDTLLDRMKKFALTVLALAASCACSAAIVQSSLNGVTIGVHTYNITFVQDDDGNTAFNDVFGSGSPELFFGDVASAQLASEAILIAGRKVGFDFTPGNGGYGFGFAFSYDAASVNYLTAYSDGAYYFAVGPFDRLRADDYFGASWVSLARVEANAVPEPGSLELLGLGLVGLAALRKRKQE